MALAELEALSVSGHAKEAGERVDELEARAHASGYAPVAVEAAGFIRAKLRDDTQHIRQRAMSIFEAHGSEGIEGTRTLLQQAEGLSRAGEHERAIQLPERAVALTERAVGRDHVDRTDGVLALGRAYIRAGKPERGNVLVDTLVALGRTADAKAVAKEARALLPPSTEPDVLAEFDAGIDGSAR